MKKLFFLSFATLAMLFSTTSCSDDDGTPIPVNETELQKVIDKLGEVDNVSQFTKVLSNASDINIGDEALTVFAVKDTVDQNAVLKEGEDSIKETINDTNIKRHIVKGTLNLSTLPSDSLVLQSIDGTSLVVSAKDGKVYVNGVLMASTTPTEVSKSLIYVMDEVLPTSDVPVVTSQFTVYEANEDWSDGADEKVASESAKIKLFKKEVDGDNVNYTVVDSILTDKDGKASLNYYTADALFYTVEKEAKTSFRDSYILTGLFTSQEQLDNAPKYETGTALDDLKLGALKVADINGDAVINESDKVEPAYIEVDKTSENIESFIVSPDYNKPVDPQS